MLNKILNKRLLGSEKEQLAAQHLKRQGCKIVARNFSSARGEIDIIARQQDCLCFVEVRYRNNKQFGGAAQSVDSRKQAKLIQTAQYYLQQHPQASDISCRFDVVAIDGEDIEWIQNAFSL